MNISDEYVVGYLQQFGHLPEPKSGDLALTVEDDRVRDAVVSFQSFVGLVPDGESGVKTKSIMRMNRCGCPDIYGVRTGRMMWRKREITWEIRGYVGDTLTQAKQEELTQAGWNSWTRHINLDIRKARKSERADIVIGAGAGRSSNFDGPAGVLAWAQLPPGNDQQLLMMFDLDEYWLDQLGVRQGIAYLNVLAHEGGHSLGLEHSRQAGALMAPIYSPAVAVPQTVDDVTRIQKLYGKRKGPPPSGPVPDGPTPAPDGWRRFLPNFHVPALAGDLISLGYAKR